MISGVDPNHVDSEKHSLVHWATVCSQPEILALLLKRQALPSTPDLYGAHALHVRLRDCQTMHLNLHRKLSLLKLNFRSLSLSLRSSLISSLSFQYATQMCTGSDIASGKEILHILLKHGANCNCADLEERTPLLWAASSGKTQHHVA